MKPGSMHVYIGIVHIMSESLMLMVITRGRGAITP